MFDTIGKDDLIMAFFPCIHFCGVSQTWFSLTHRCYKNWDIKKTFDYILSKSKDRSYFYDILNKLVGVCLMKGIRLVFENPIEGQYFLRVFLKQPDIVDNNRMLRGDYMIKPTGFWFWNCEPTNGFTYQNDKTKIQATKLPPAKERGLCGEERSLISPDYARNFICDFILGKSQPNICRNLFD